MKATAGNKRAAKPRARHQDQPERIALKEWLRGRRRELGLGPADMSEGLGFLNPNDYLAAERGVVRILPPLYGQLAKLIEVDASLLARRLLKAYHPDIFAVCFASEDLTDTAARDSSSDMPPAEAGPEKLAALRAKMGKRLAILRKETGRSQGEVAQRMGFADYNAISSYERGAAAVPLERYIAYADVLGADRQSFIQELMAYYEPSMHDYLFNDRSA